MGSLNSSHLKGVIGEEIALHHLSRHGYRLIARNFRCRYGEVDIIAAQGADICFVEVKAWRNLAYEEIGRSINLHKQRRIINSARLFLKAHQQFSSYCPQFGVLFINLRTTVCRYIKNAFEEEYEWHEPLD